MKRALVVSAELNVVGLQLVICPRVGAQIAREYSYCFATVSPHDGVPDSPDVIEDRLVETLGDLKQNRRRVQGIAGFDWIVNIPMNAT